MAFEINYNGSSMKAGLDQMSAKVGIVVMMYAKTKAVEIEASMKRNRPWTDRTGMAKALLNVQVSRPDPQTVRITLAHGVQYGLWLELANGKNYAVIGPTINLESPKVIADLAGLMAKLQV